MADISRQWQQLIQREFLHIDDGFLETFRAPGSRNKFVAGDPREPSYRYFKLLLFNPARKQSKRFVEAYRALGNRQLGNPLTVKCCGCDIDADYLAAVEEWEFLSDAGALDRARTVIEIGAGFGRTCHTLLTLCPGIKEYIIVDLDPMLRLSSAYLQRAIPGANIRFISNERLADLDSVTPDLVINIDSFQEMPPPVIESYMTGVVQRAKRFYCKNPVAKYLPASVGLPDLDSQRVLDVFTLGYCRDVIDIFSDEDLERARDTFIEAYRPSGYRAAASKPMDLFPYYLHVLYTCGFRKFWRISSGNSDHFACRCSGRLR
jgi:hypothetical protein